MPIYEYNCEKCNKHFEIVRKINDLSSVKCPYCGEIAKRIMSQTSFTLKGSGWYKDGYASGGSKAKPCNSCKKDCKAKAGDKK